MSGRKGPPCKTERFRFIFFIGDTSGDGHDITEDFCASAAKGEAAIKKAWAAAERKLPKCLRPNNFCRHYGDIGLPPKIAKDLIKRGAPVPDNWEDMPFEPQDMAEIVLWFMNQGDPKLDARLEEEDRPTVINLPCNIGYGLFGY